METLTIPFGFLSFSRVIRRIGLLFPAPQLTLVTRINIFGHYGAREIVNLMDCIILRIIYICKCLKWRYFFF